MFARLLGTFLLRRFLRGRQRRSGWGSPYGYGRRPRGRVGLFGPFPTYSNRTRGGSRVTVSGCCLPLPLTLVVGALLGIRSLLRR